MSYNIAQNNLNRELEIKKQLAQIDKKMDFEFSRLLKQAPPSREKAHQLLNLIARDFPELNEAKIRESIATYYRTPYELRTSAHFFNVFGIKPYPWLQSQFVIHFGNAHISDTKLFKLASNFRHIFNNTIHPPSELTQADFLHLTLYNLVKPRSDQKQTGIRLIDFVDIWERSAHYKWGAKYQSYFDYIKRLLDFENDIISLAHSTILEPNSITNNTSIKMTQTDLNWMKDLLNALEKNDVFPRFPHSKGPRNRITKLLENATRLTNNNKNRQNTKTITESIRKLCTSFLRHHNQLTEHSTG